MFKKLFGKKLTPDEEYEKKLQERYESWSLNELKEEADAMINDGTYRTPSGWIRYNLLQKMIEEKESDKHN